MRITEKEIMMKYKINDIVQVNTYELQVIGKIVAGDNKSRTSGHYGQQLQGCQI